MTWTYTPDFDLARDQVRFLVGDTDTTDQLVQDEEIAWIVTDSGDNVKRAAARVAEAIAAKFSRKADKEIGDLRLSLSQKAKSYLELAKKLWDQAGGAGAVIPLAAPWAGGLRESEKEVYSTDTDLVQPAFTRDLDEIIDVFGDSEDDLRD